MKLKLAAEIFAKCYGIMILDDDFLVEINQSEIPSELLENIKKWYSEYYRFTGMSTKELELNESTIKALDIRGKKLLYDIYESSVFENIHEFVYYSRGKDKILLKLDSRGRAYNLIDDNK